MMNIPLLAFCVFALSGHAHCDSSSDKRVTDGANCFTLNMYKELAKENENLVSSPFSLSVLLSMLYLGSGGKTAQELSTSLGYNDLSAQEIENAFQSKLSKLTSSNDNTLELANSLWIRQGLSIKQKFKDVVSSKFFSQEMEANFQGNANGATKSINSWGNAKTHGLIPKLLDEDLSTDTIMFLANAIYFKGKWENEFDKDDTTPGKFKNNDSPRSLSTVQLMNQRSKFFYHQDRTLDAEVLEMEYQDGNISMILMLPQSGRDIGSLERSLTCQTFNRGINFQTSKQLVDVTMPKFDITSNFDLTGPIGNVGIESALSRSANFSGIVPNIYISKAVQKAVIKVNEAGSEAAAFTGFQVVPYSLSFSVSRVVYFRADHPFLYIIRDNRTGLILFMGRVKSLPNSS